MESRGLADANPRQGSPSGPCSTSFGPWAHCPRRYRSRRGAKGRDGTAGFGGGDVEVSLGEVGDPADVVEVEVGEHNVSNVGRAVAELFDLAGRGFGLQECRPQDMTE